MICPFCGSSDIQGPSRLTVAWQRRAGSPLNRQWFLESEAATLMACGNCHEEFDATKWFGMQPEPTVAGHAA